jgi:KipI family sensor histidine kinase inhibitor
VGPVVTIPVVYDGADLDSVAELAGISVAEVIDRHAGPEFVVGWMGFAPGFAYLTGLDPVLHVPRLDTPRTSVPVGSVAVAGPYSAVYPTASPGGWRLLGRTSVRVWDVAGDPPSLFRPGTRVRFERA